MCVCVCVCVYVCVGVCVRVCILNKTVYLLYSVIYIATPTSKA